MVIYSVLIAILLGALIGLQREYNQIHEKVIQFAGIRTFMLISLLGAILAHLSVTVLENPWLIIIGFFIVSVLAITAYALEFFKAKDVGATTEVAAILTFIVGVLCGLGLIREGVIFGILITVVLTFKENIHKFAETIQKKELIAIVQLAVLSLVILPLLPNKEYSPVDIPVLATILESFGVSHELLMNLTVFNPYHFWWMVLLVAGISFLGYVLVKFLGTRKGYGLTGLVGGLASSTAVTLAMSHESKKQNNITTPLIIAVVVATATSFMRVLLEVSIVNSSLLGTLLVPLILMSLVGYGTALVLYVREKKKPSPNKIEIEQPFNIMTALKFAAFFVCIIIFAKLAQIIAGTPGLYVAGLLSGLADVDAITLTMAKLSNLGEISNLVASTTIILAVASNTLVKAGIAWVFGARAFAQHILYIFIAMLTVGLGTLFIVA